MSKPILAWHFLAAEGVLRDGRPVKVGEWLTHEGPLNICSAGLHASRSPLDALEYAPGSIVCRVEIRGEMIEQSDKLCCRERRIIWMVDASRELRLFAADCAERALKMCKRKGYKTDPRSWAAVDAARKYARGEIDDAARAAARDAAWAARDAAWSADRAAAWAAARAAAWAAWAARDAAWAARDAAWSADRAAAWAAWDADRDAERAWQLRRLNRWIKVAEKCSTTKGGAK